MEHSTYLLKEDGTCTAFFPKNGEYFTLPELYERLGCDTIEVTKLQQEPENPNDLIMIGDQNGRYDDATINFYATQIYKLVWLKDFSPQKALDEALNQFNADFHKYAILPDSYKDIDNPYNIVGNIILCQSKMLK
jgi:hypothetical protein